MMNSLKCFLDYIENYYSQNDDKNTWFEKMRNLAEGDLAFGAAQFYTHFPWRPSETRISESCWEGDTSFYHSS